MSELLRRGISRWTCIGCTGCLCGLFASVAVLCWLKLAICNPSNRMDVTFRNVPADTERISILKVGDGLDRIQGRYWFKWGVPHASTGGLHWEWRPPDDPAVPSDVYHFQWIPGSLYGVLTRSKGKDWTVTWFDAADVPISRWPLVASGSIEFDLAKGRPELVPEDRVKKLMLDYKGP